MTRLLGFAVTLILFLWPVTASAWGNAGHMVVCQIAYARLTPATRAEVDRLLPLFRRYETFAESGTYPDNPPILDGGYRTGTRFPVALR